MLYNSFVVITDTPQRLANFLVSRGIIQEEPPGSGNYMGVLPGMEWVKVPNPIQTAPASGTPGQPGYIPPTYDSRSVYLVKFAHESEDDQESEGVTTVPVTDSSGVTVDMPGNPYDWSKFGKWIKANSTTVSSPAGWTIQGQPAGDAYKINGQNVWLVRDQPERFGVWQ